jgi:soluble lytic murein transglycosylase-like protein
MTPAVVSLVMAYASLAGLDPMLVLSVIKVESNFNSKAVGPRGEVGLMQLMPKYFKAKRKKLFDPKTNVRLGIEHLARAKAQCRHQEEHTWLVCYNLGVAGGSRLKRPQQWSYYRKVMKEYAVMKKWTPGQKVVVLAAYASGADGEGVVLRPSKERGHEGKWLIDIDGLYMHVEASRLMTEDEYTELQKAKPND